MNRTIKKIKCQNANKKVPVNSLDASHSAHNLPHKIVDLNVDCHKITFDEVFSSNASSSKQKPVLNPVLSQQNRNLLSFDIYGEDDDEVSSEFEECVKAGQTKITDIKTKCKTSQNTELFRSLSKGSRRKKSAEKRGVSPTESDLKKTKLSSMND